MGDARFTPVYQRILSAADHQSAVAFLDDEEVVQALAAASREHDPLLANVLATEAMNRMLRARGILASMVEGACALDADGVCTFLNPAGERLLGWKAAELRGFDFHEVVHFQHADGENYRTEDCPIRGALAKGETISVEEDVFTRRDGALVRVAYTAAPLVWQGDCRGTVVTFRPLEPPA